MAINYTSSFPPLFLPASLVDHRVDVVVAAAAELANVPFEGNGGTLKKLAFARAICSFSAVMELL